MLVINFKGNTPQTRFNTIGVKGDNNSNKVGFLFQKIQEEIDLGHFTAYLKVENKEDNFFDEILLDKQVDEDYVFLTWTIARKSTHYRNLELQVVFEDNDNDVVWQSMLFEAELGDSIKIDDIISDENPTLIEQLKRIVASFNARLENLEQHAVMDSDIVDNLESTDSEKVLSAKQGQILNEKVNMAITSAYKPRGSRTVAQINSMDTSTLINGDVFDMSDSGTITLGNIQVIAGDNIAWIVDNNVGRWDKLAGLVDLSNYVDKASDQTITGFKYFTNGIGFGEQMSIESKANASILDIKRYGNILYRFAVSSFLPNLNNNNDLGTEVYHWKDLYLSGGLKFGNAVLSYNNAFVFNDDVIPANDTISLGKSTNQWKDLYMAGSVNISGENYTGGIKNYSNRLTFSYGGTDRFWIGNSEVKSANPIIPNSDNTYDLGSSTANWKDIYLSGNCVISDANLGTHYLKYNTSNVVGLSSSAIYVNWKLSTTTIEPQITGNTNLGSSSKYWQHIYFTGALKDGGYSASLGDLCSQFNPTDTGTTEIKWSKMLSFSLSANTTFTFETAKTNCLNEYKATITNSGSSAITLTFTGVNHILTNDSSITVNGNALTLPNGSTIELSCVNGNAIAINFEA